VNVFAIFDHTTENSIKPFEKIRFSSGRW